jgi:hypothetical protein
MNIKTIITSLFLSISLWAMDEQIQTNFPASYFFPEQREELNSEIDKSLRLLSGDHEVEVDISNNKTSISNILKNGVSLRRLAYHFILLGNYDYLNLDTVNFELRKRNYRNNNNISYYKACEKLYVNNLKKIIDDYEKYDSQYDFSKIYYTLVSLRAFSFIHSALLLSGTKSSFLFGGKFAPNMYYCDLIRSKPLSSGFGNCGEISDLISEHYKGEFTAVESDMFFYNITNIAHAFNIIETDEYVIIVDCFSYVIKFLDLGQLNNGAYNNDKDLINYYGLWTKCSDGKFSYVFGNSDNFIELVREDFFSKIENFKLTEKEKK